MYIFTFFTTALSQWDFSHGKFGLPSPGKASCNSHATHPTMHAECFSVFIVHQTLTWSTGSLTCAQMKMHVIAHGGVCIESWLYEKNPLPRQEIEPASAAWCSDAPETELHPNPNKNSITTLTKTAFGKSDVCKYTMFPSLGLCCGYFTRLSSKKNVSQRNHISVFWSPSSHLRPRIKCAHGTNVNGESLLSQTKISIKNFLSIKSQSERIRQTCSKHRKDRTIVSMSLTTRTQVCTHQ